MRHRCAGRAAAIIAVSAVTCVVTGCSSGPHKQVRAAPRPDTTVASTTTVPPTTTTTPPVAPLTGLFQPNPFQLSAPAVVVKVDNIDAARPQSGINQADVVYEELVEGGLTRLAAVFQSQYPPSVGPVRSGRLTDIPIVDDLNHPVLAFAGANGLFLPQLRSQQIDDIDIDNRPGLFVMNPSRLAPHNLYTNVAIDASTDRPAGPPPPLFTYRAGVPPLAAFGTRPAGQVALAWPAARVVWTYIAPFRLWAREQNGRPDVDQSGAVASAANVVVQAVPYVTSAFADEPGSGLTPIPEGELIGSGPAWVFSGGAAVQGQWTRASLNGVTAYTDSAGHPIALAPGRTWVELIQLGSAPVIH